MNEIALIVILLIVYFQEKKIEILENKVSEIRKYLGGK